MSPWSKELAGVLLDLDNQCKVIKGKLKNLNFKQLQRFQLKLSLVIDDHPVQFLLHIF